MAASPGFRIGAIALLAGLGLALVLALSGAFSGDADAAAEGTPPKALLLRPGDLPEGYEYFSPDWDGVHNPDVTCARISIPDAGKKLEKWIEDYAPRGCYALFTRLGDRSAGGVSPVPPLIGSGAVDVGSTKGAHPGFDLALTLLDHASEGKLTRKLPLTAVGKETALLRSRNRFVGELSGGGTNTSWVVWRSGDTLSVVMVGGGPPKQNDAEAFDLAQHQQERIR